MLNGKLTTAHELAEIRGLIDGLAWKKRRKRQADACGYVQPAAAVRQSACSATSVMLSGVQVVLSGEDNRSSGK